MGEAERRGRDRRGAPGLTGPIGEDVQREAPVHVFLAHGADTGQDKESPPLATVAGQEETE